MLSVDAVAALTNTGLMEAVNKAKLGILNPVNGVVSNKDGIIQAIGRGSTFETNTRIDGGVIKGLSGGVAIFGNATLDGRQNTVTLEGASVFGGTLLQGTIANNGTMTCGGQLKIAAEDATLSGGGTVRMAGA